MNLILKKMVKLIDMRMYITIFFGIFLISVLMFAPSISTTGAEQDFIIPSWIKIMQVGGLMGK